MVMKLIFWLSSTPWKSMRCPTTTTCKKPGLYYLKDKTCASDYFASDGDTQSSRLIRSASYDQQLFYWESLRINRMNSLKPFDNCFNMFQPKRKNMGCQFVQSTMWGTLNMLNGWRVANIKIVQNPGHGLNPFWKIWVNMEIFLKIGNQIRKKHLNPATRNRLYHYMPK